MPGFGSFPLPSDTSLPLQQNPMVAGIQKNLLNPNTGMNSMLTMMRFMQNQQMQQMRMENLMQKQALQMQNMELQRQIRENQLRDYEFKQQYGRTAKQQEANLLREKNQQAALDLANNADFVNAFQATKDASTVKRQKVLDELYRNFIVPATRSGPFAGADPVAVKEALLGPEHRKLEAEKKAINDVGWLDRTWDRVKQSANSTLGGLRNMNPFGSTNDTNRIAKEVEDANNAIAAANPALLEDRRRAAEGEGWWGRGDLLSNAVSSAPSFAAYAAPAIAGAAAGARIGGSVLGLPGAAIGALLGTAFSALLGGSESSVDYSSRIMNSGMSDAEKQKALDDDSARLLASGAGFVAGALPSAFGTVGRTVTRGLTSMGLNATGKAMKAAGSAAERKAIELQADRAARFAAATRSGLGNGVRAAVNDAAAFGSMGVINTVGGNMGYNWAVDDKYEVPTFSGAGDALMSGAFSGALFGGARSAVNRGRVMPDAQAARIKALYRPDGAIREPIAAIARDFKNAAPGTDPIDFLNRLHANHYDNPQAFAQFVKDAGVSKADQQMLQTLYNLTGNPAEQQARYQKMLARQQQQQQQQQQQGPQTPPNAPTPQGPQTPPSPQTPPNAPTPQGPQTPPSPQTPPNAPTPQGPQTPPSPQTSPSPQGNAQQPPVSPQQTPTAPPSVVQQPASQQAPAGKGKGKQNTTPPPSVTQPTGSPLDGKVAVSDFIKQVMQNKSFGTPLEAIKTLDEIIRTYGDAADIDDIPKAFGPGNLNIKGNTLVAIARSMQHSADTRALFDKIVKWDEALKNKSSKASVQGIIDDIWKDMWKSSYNVDDIFAASMLASEYANANPKNKLGKALHKLANDKNYFLNQLEIFNEKINGVPQSADQGKEGTAATGTGADSAVEPPSSVLDELTPPTGPSVTGRNSASDTGTGTGRSKTSDVGENEVHTPTAEEQGNRTAANGTGPTEEPPAGGRASDAGAGGKNAEGERGTGNAQQSEGTGGDAASGNKTVEELTKLYSNYVKEHSIGKAASFEEYLKQQNIKNVPAEVIAKVHEHIQTAIKDSRSDMMYRLQYANKMYKTVDELRADLDDYISNSSRRYHFTKEDVDEYINNLVTSGAELNPPYILSNDYYRWDAGLYEGNMPFKEYLKKYKRPYSEEEVDNYLREMAETNKMYDHAKYLYGKRAYNESFAKAERAYNSIPPNVADHLQKLYNDFIDKQRTNEKGYKSFSVFAGKPWNRMKEVPEFKKYIGDFENYKNAQLAKEYSDYREAQYDIDSDAFFLAADAQSFDEYLQQKGLAFNDLAYHNLYNTLRIYEGERAQSDAFNNTTPNRPLCF